MKMRYLILLFILATLVAVMGHSVVSTIDSCADKTSTLTNCAKINQSVEKLAVATGALTVVADAKAPAKSAEEVEHEAWVNAEYVPNSSASTRVSSFAVINGKNVLRSIGAANGDEVYLELAFNCATGYYSIPSQYTRFGGQPIAEPKEYLVPANTPIVRAYRQQCAK